MRIRITFLGSPFRTCSSKTLLGVLGVTRMALSSSEFLGASRSSLEYSESKKRGVSSFL